MCIQEHWLYSYDKHKLQNFTGDHNFIAKSVDDDKENENFINLNRGYGGVATFWKKDIDHAIRNMPDGNYSYYIEHQRTFDMCHQRIYAVLKPRQ